jgi:hypothetical protein
VRKWMLSAVTDTAPLIGSRRRELLPDRLFVFDSDTEWFPRRPSSQLFRESKTESRMLSARYAQAVAFVAISLTEINNSVSWNVILS